MFLSCFNFLSLEYTIPRFRQCALQCVQTVLGLFGLINACVPLVAEDILYALSYPCPLQFFTSNDQVWSASRIDAATASPVVCAKRTNAKNSLCILQVSSTNRIHMESCSIFETSSVIGENREERCMLWNFTDNLFPQILHCYLYYVILNGSRLVSSISCAPA